MRSKYVGPVATGCVLADNQVGSSIKEFMSRRPHYARDDINGILGIFNMTLQNFWNSELATGGTAHYTASIEYPAGTFTQVTFFGGSANSGTVADQSVVVSDNIPVVIPQGALFWSRVWGSFTSSSGAPFIAVSSNSVLGEGYAFSNTTTPDLTLGGSVAAGGGSFAPIALLGTTRRPTVGILGDSRVIGQLDTPDITGNLGTLARLVGDNFGYLNLAAGGSTTQAYVNSHTIRNALMSHVSHIVMALGFNDLATSVPLATTQANFATIGGYFTQPLLISTVMAQVTTTDGYATEVNQTVSLDPTLLNNWIRECPAPFSRVLDLVRAEEVPFGTGKFFCNGLGSVSMPSGERPTGDGIHETRYMMQRLLAANVLDRSFFR